MKRKEDARKNSEINSSKTEKKNKVEKKVQKTIKQVNLKKKESGPLLHIHLLKKWKISDS